MHSYALTALSLLYMEAMYRAGTRRFRAAYLTVWGVPERRTDRMDADMQTAQSA